MMTDPKTIIVVIDVFRAFTTAAYILDQNPKHYYFTNKSSVVRRLQQQSSILVGKPEIGEALPYTVPNSPTRVRELPLNNKVVIHRTEAGGNGVMNAQNADLILVLSFPTLHATVRYLKHFKKAQIIIRPMGHEGVTPSLGVKVKSGVWREGGVF